MSTSSLEEDKDKDGHVKERGEGRSGSNTMRLLTSLVVEVVRLLLRQRDDKVPVLRGDSFRVVPF